MTVSTIVREMDWKRFLVQVEILSTILVAMLFVVFGSDVGESCGRKKMNKRGRKTLL